MIMDRLITMRPTGNSRQRRQQWRAFKSKYEPLGYRCKNHPKKSVAIKCGRGERTHSQTFTAKMD